jgi:hypothetical protein
MPVRYLRVGTASRNTPAKIAPPPKPNQPGRWSRAEGFETALATDVRNVSVEVALVVEPPSVTEAGLMEQARKAVEDETEQERFTVPL